MGVPNAIEMNELKMIVDESAKTIAQRIEDKPNELSATDAALITMAIDLHTILLMMTTIFSKEISDAEVRETFSAMANELRKAP